MAFIKTTIFVLVVVAAFSACMAANATYFVGEDKGWRRLGFNFYPNWASGKNFHVGDTLVFQYAPDEHDVVEVNEEDFESCTAPEAPLHAYHSGVDKIVLQDRGRYFFICSSRGHCAAGQKLGILVDYKLPGNQTGYPFGSGGRNPDPFSSGIGASSTMYSNLFIAIMLGWAATIAF